MRHLHLNFKNKNIEISWFPEKTPNQTKEALAGQNTDRLSQLLAEINEYNLLSIDKQTLVVKVLEESHRVLKKNFETEMYVDGEKLPLNNFVQETLGNIMTGFLKTLKGRDASTPDLIEVKIKRLSKAAEVDAHVYPVQ